MWACPQKNKEPISKPLRWLFVFLASGFRVRTAPCSIPHADHVPEKQLGKTHKIHFQKCIANKKTSNSNINFG